MDKKNTLVLTVIAVATLLVAMVGATFAYFTAQQAGDQNTQINVTTETTNNSEFDADKTLTITADMSNFAEGDVGESREEGTYDEASPTVKLTSGSNSGGAEICYNVSLIVDDAGEKKFGYSEANSSKNPELVLYIHKTPGSDADNEGTAGEITTITGLTHKTDIGETTDTQKEVGFDVTEANGQTYKIPTLSSQASEQDYVHHLKATGNNETVTDTWKLRIVMINYNFDQERNAGKTFTAKVQFHSVDCA